jgi:hypothetical protein
MREELDVPSTPDTPTAPGFTPALLGQTEKTLNAILARLLAGTGVSEPMWVTLTLAVTAGETIDREAFIGRVARALRVEGTEAAELVGELLAAGLIEAAGTQVGPSEAGLALHTSVRRKVAEITEQLWGDLPATDLATAARVLTTIRGRAEAELDRQPG